MIVYQVQLFKYDQVLLNDMGGLNSTTGVFTAPVKGVYHFSCSAMKRRTRKHLHLVMMKNNQAMNNEVFLATSVQNYDTSSGVPVTVQATVPLEIGDRVYVQRRLWNVFTLLPATSDDNAALEKSIYFTGFLIPDVNLCRPRSTILTYLNRLSC